MMRSIKPLSRRIDKIEAILLFRGELQFYEKLNDEDITKLLCCLTREELNDIINEPDEIAEELIEQYYNKYKEIMNDVFPSDQELKLHMDDIDFVVKYMTSLSKSEREKLKYPDSRVSKKLDELVIYRKNKKDLSDARFQSRN